MLSLFGRDQVVTNLCRLVKAHNAGFAIEDVADLRNGYIAFLRDRQGLPVLGRGIEDIFVQDDHVESVLGAAFKKGALNDLNQADVLGNAYLHEIRQAKISIASKALTQALSLDEDFCFIFGLVVHSVFVRPCKRAPGARGSHGGSSSAAIGSIWLTVAEDIGQIDLIEMYIHELAHHLLFIDELNHPQFNYDCIASKDNFALSAILKKSRPLDKVIHSIVVASEILGARRSFLHSDEETAIHPATDALIRDTLASIGSVEGLKNIGTLITPHLRGVLEQCREMCLRCQRLVTL